MKLSDYFKPKWQRSDLQIRIEAIKKITDEHKLLSVINTDPSLEARLEAVRMMNPDVESDRLEEARRMRENMGDNGDRLFDKIRDRMWNKIKILKDIVKKNYPTELRIEALKFINHSSDLRELGLIVTHLTIFKELYNKIKANPGWDDRGEIIKKYQIKLS